MFEISCLRLDPLRFNSDRVALRLRWRGSSCAGPQPQLKLKLLVKNAHVAKRLRPKWECSRVAFPPIATAMSSKAIKQIFEIATGAPSPLALLAVLVI
jgi:hypothetical protein